MSKKRKNYKVDSKEVGLELGLRVYKFFFKSEYIHYGYFSDGLEVDVLNLKKAQDNYAELLFSHIPENVRTILDVGCGSGKTAEELLARGYKVDCVSPGHILTEYAEEKLGNRVNFFKCKFEDIITENKYDLVLLSESFQYIPMDKSIPGAVQLLNPGGYIMVSDFFSTDPEGKSKLGGGHDYQQWLGYKDSFPLKLLVEKDITTETSMTLDLVNKLNQEVLKPLWTSVWALAEDRFPLGVKIARKLYRKNFKSLKTSILPGKGTANSSENIKNTCFTCSKPTINH